MQINPKEIRNHFEKSMEKYDENAVVQKFLAGILADETAAIQKDFGRVLELGCGTGLLTRNLVEKISYKSYTANDLTQKSKKHLDKILPEYDYICANAQKINPSGGFDLIISNAMFQWFKNLDAVLEKYKRFLNKNGILAFTTFSPENFTELTKLTGLTLDYKSEDELKEIVGKNFKIIKVESMKKVLEFKSPLELLYHMKNTGVNSLGSKNWTFADVKDFCDKYSKTFDKVTLTYTPILVIAQKLN